MKKKLLVFFGFVLLLTSFVSIITSSPTYAAITPSTQCALIPDPNCEAIKSCMLFGNKTEAECRQSVTTQNGATSLKCGDSGFNCVMPNTINCDIFTNTTTKQKCIAVKACMVTAKKSAANCDGGWNDCVASYGSGTVDYLNCVKYISAGDFANAKASNASTQTKTSCSIDYGLGWIICPALRTTAALVDKAYAQVATLLTVQPLSTKTTCISSNDPECGTYKAWSVMRNFANAAFVIAFLIVIYSQLTGFGISNYGVKKLLPRIVAVAILVNISYWLCAIAIDVSNIAGKSLYDILEGINRSLYADGHQSGSNWMAIVEGVLGAGALLYVGLSVAGPILVSAMVVIVSTLVILTFRQGIIIMLTVGSPLIIVAYLLPNLNSLANKGKDLFKNLLIMYPAVSVAFGASDIGSTVITNAANTNGSHNIALQSMGAGVQIIGLVLAFTLIKTSVNVLSRVGGIVNNPNKGPFDRARKGTENYKDYRQNLRKGAALSGTRLVIGGRQFRRAARKDARNKAVEGAVDSGEAQFGVTDAKTAAYIQSMNQSKAQASAIGAANNTRSVSNLAQNPGSITQGMGMAAADDEVAKALAAQQERAVAEAIKDAKLSADIAPGDLAAMGRMMKDAMREGDSIKARAAQDMLLQSGGAGLKQYRASMMDMEGTIDKNGRDVFSGNTMEEMRRNVLEHHGGVKASAKDIMDQAVSGGAMSGHAKDKKNWTMSDAEMVQQKPLSIQLAIRSGALDKVQADRIMANPELSKNLDPNVRKEIVDIQGGADGTKFTPVI
jgi:hypothetical protein